MVLEVPMLHELQTALVFQSPFVIAAASLHNFHGRCL